jgi:hypothetical protein
MRWLAAPFSRFSSRPRSPTACGLGGRSGLRDVGCGLLNGTSIGGLIKIQDDQVSEANSTMTKFCSDPQCVLSGEKGTQKRPLPPPKRVSSTAFARVSDGSVSTANYRQGAEPIVCRYISPTCVCRKFAGDMSHRPSKLINEKMHCHGLFVSSRPSKVNDENMHQPRAVQTSEVLQK